MKNMGSVVCFAILLCLAEFAHSVVGTKTGLEQRIQLKEHVAGTITRIDGKRLRVLEDVDPMGCSTSGVRLVDILDTTKLLRSGAVITETDLQSGDRVVIEATARGEILEATGVRIEDLSSTEHKH